MRGREKIGPSRRAASRGAVLQGPGDRRGAGEAAPESAAAPVPGPKEKRPHHLGHRRRLRDRFMAAGADNLADYELLELLLFYSIPRADVKPRAKELIARFGSLGAVLAAEPKRLAEVGNLGAHTIAHLKAVRAAALRLLREEVMERPILSSWQKVVDYCRASMAHDKTERFRILFLDHKNALIADEVQQRGTVDHAPVYPREVVKRALDLGASAVVMVHNHPSGDPTPSRADIDITRQVKDACKAVGIVLHDHFIVGRASYASFKTLGLL